MNDDLISRKKVMDYLREQQLQIIVEKNKKGLISKDTADGMMSAADAFSNFIIGMPIAYDVDKVVEQLEECITDTTDTETGTAARWVYKGAIEIVKAGGVSEF